MLSCIVSIDENNAIGLNNELLIYLKEDMKHFKEITLNKTVIMGRKTYESLPEKNRPLPNRKNIVLTKNPRAFINKYGYDTGVLLIDNLNENSYKNMIQSNKEFIIIGGSSIYKKFMPYIDTIYLTRILDSFEADSFFEYNKNDFRTESFTDVMIDENTNISFYFETLKRKTANGV